MHRLNKVLLAAGLALAACAAAPRVTGFRDPARNIYSSAVFDPARLTGEWRQVGDFADAPGCPPGAVRFAPAPIGIVVEGRLCLAGVPTPLSGALATVGPGRFGLAGVTDALWVLWADTDVRTLVIGTPSGRFGVILNRGGDLPPDRLVAAREVLDWNGYDTDRLRISR